MPDYKYKCHKCDTETTITCSMKYYSPTTTCPTCNTEIFRKVEDLVCGYQDNKDFYGKTSK